jgi:hypothetical protein
LTPAGRRIGVSYQRVKGEEEGRVRTEADFELAGLVVGAVGDGDEFFVLAAASDGEPGFEIALHSGRVVCSTR